jgi:hypothetical protein
MSWRYAPGRTGWIADTGHGRGSRRARHWAKHDRAFVGEPADASAEALRYSLEQGDRPLEQQ